MNRLQRLTRTQKLIIWFVLIALVSFILGFFVRTVIPIAQVNGEFIGRNEFLKKLAISNGQSVLEGMIAEKLIAQSLKDAKIVVTNKEIEAKIVSMKQDLKDRGATFEALLASTKQTPDSFRKELKTQLGVEKLLKNTIKVSDKEINDYFRANGVVKGKDAVYRSQLLSIRDTIYRAKLRQAFLNWYQLQKGKAKVQYFIGL